LLREGLEEFHSSCCSVKWVEALKREK
jgi:hypothetical protein